MAARNKKLESKNLIYVGVDQTGAINPKGFPRPLPACTIVGQTVNFFYLPSFTAKDIVLATDESQKNNLVICVDCVLGLPKELKMKWRDALKLINTDSGYGREPAKAYFKILGGGQKPRRKIELAVQANSVFDEMPFQKNIQTGTFRIWKDISLNEFDFYAPALEKRKFVGQIPIFEGYPTLSWKLILKAKSRKPLELKTYLKKHAPDLLWTRKNQAMIQKDQNFADAFVLALTIKLLYKKAIDLKPNPEGWILGANL